VKGYQFTPVKASRALNRLLAFREFLGRLQVLITSMRSMIDDDL
jgi:hypothetical protein